MFEKRQTQAFIFDISNRVPIRKTIPRNSGPFGGPIGDPPVNAPPVNPLPFAPDSDLCNPFFHKMPDARPYPSMPPPLLAPHVPYGSLEHHPLGLPPRFQPLMLASKKSNPGDKDSKSKNKKKGKSKSKSSKRSRSKKSKTSEDNSVTSNRSSSQGSKSSKTSKGHKSSNKSNVTSSSSESESTGDSSSTEDSATERKSKKMGRSKRTLKNSSQKFSLDDLLRREYSGESGKVVTTHNLLKLLQKGYSYNDLAACRFKGTL